MPKRNAASTSHSSDLKKIQAAFERSWADVPGLTPRQAFALSATLDGWADMYLRTWLDDPSEPLHEVTPFSSLDLRVMMLAGESRAWVQAVRDRCYLVSDEIEQGILPFDRPGPFIDEVLMAAALPDAEALLTDLDDLFTGIAPRQAVETDETYMSGDDEWDLVSDDFDDRCRWEDWEVPLRGGHPLLPALLSERHPYTWFDLVGPSGPGQLAGPSGLRVPEEPQS